MYCTAMHFVADIKITLHIRMLSPPPQWKGYDIRS